MSSMNGSTRPASGPTPAASYAARTRSRSALPVWCQSSKPRARSPARPSTTASLMARAPWLPPTTSTRRHTASGAQGAALSAASRMAARTGLPVSSARRASKNPWSSGKDKKTLSTQRPSRRLAAPGRLFCSCRAQGTPRRAAMATGAKPA